MNYKAVNFVAYLNPKFYSGGGEAVNLEIIKALEAKGYKVKISSFRPFKISISLFAKFNIFADIDNKTAYPKKSNLFRIPLSFLKILHRIAPFIHMQNAYVDICDKEYLPCNGSSNDNKCPFDNNLCYSTQTRSLYLSKKSLFNVYVSPLHKKVCEGLLNLYSERSYVLGPLIDKNRFQNTTIKRDIENLFVGVISEAKGFKWLKNFSKNNDLTLLGKVEPGLQLDFGKHIGFVSYDEVPSIMARAKRFVYHPRWPEPQGRVVHEAALSGCDLDLNENVGAASFDFDLSDPKNYRNYAFDLISEIEIKLEHLSQQRTGCSK